MSRGTVGEGVEAVPRRIRRESIPTADACERERALSTRAMTFLDAYESRRPDTNCEPQGQFVSACQRDSGRERHEEFQDGHAVEPREQAGGGFIGSGIRV